VYESKNIYVKLKFQRPTFLNAIRCMYTPLNFRALVTEDHDNDGNDDDDSDNGIKNSGKI
jgi:hypothetical protein